VSSSNGRGGVARFALILAGVAAVVFALSRVALVAFPRTEAMIAQPIDFLAFDCAAKVGATRADPYLAEPLRSCERGALAESGITIVPNLVVPAPLPPYALAAFSVLAPLSFRDASALWWALALVAIGATIVLVRTLTGAPLAVVTVVILTADAFASVPIGQVVPLVLCSLCAAATALRGGRPRLAALLTLPLMLEPHVGLPVAVALFVWEPRARRTLLGGAVLLGLLSLAAGPARSLEYLRVVLPAQARGEGLEFGGQYSLSALLAVLGVAPGLALALGSASYLVMAGWGVTLAGRVAAKLEDPAVVLLLPPSFAVALGTYVHIHQMAFAVPLVLLLLMRRPRLRLLTATALLALAIPWETLGEIPGIGPAHAPPHHTDVAAQLARVSSGALPAEVAWGVWVRSGERDSRTAWERFECKLPTWFGLVLLIASAAAVARERDAPRGAASALRAASGPA
jgi:hypothetical protein